MALTSVLFPESGFGSLVFTTMNRGNIGDILFMMFDDEMMMNIPIVVASGGGGVAYTF